MARAVAISYVGVGGAFASSVLLARFFGAEGKGIFSLFQTTVALVATLTAFGIGHGQMYYCGRDPGKLPHFLPNSTALALLVGSGAAAVLLGLGERLGLRAVTSLGWQGLLAGLLCIPTMMLLTFQRQYLLITQRFELAKLSLAVTQFSPLLAIAAVVVAGAVAVQTAVLAFVACHVACLLAFQLFIATRGEEWWGGFSWPLAKQSSVFGLKQYLSDVSLALTSRLDFFVVATLLGNDALGLYSVAVGLAEIVSRFASELGSMLFPAFAARQIPSGRAPGILGVVLLMAAGVALGMALVARPLVSLLYGSQFEESVASLRWLLPGTVAWSSIFVTWNHASAHGRPGTGVVIFGLAAGVDLVLSVLLIPWLGVSGASIAATLSYWFAGACFLRLFCRSEKTSLWTAVVVGWGELRLLSQRFMMLVRLRGVSA